MATMSISAKLRHWSDRRHRVLLEESLIESMTGVTVSRWTPLDLEVGLTNFVFNLSEFTSPLDALLVINDSISEPGGTDETVTVTWRDSVSSDDISSPLAPGEWLLVGSVDTAGSLTLLSTGTDTPVRAFVASA